MNPQPPRGIKGPRRPRLESARILTATDSRRRLLETVLVSRNPPRLKQVYGRAFLIHLNRGDVGLATVFARAFLMAKNGDGIDQA
jgi:hypothetical protein